MSLAPPTLTPAPPTVTPPAPPTLDPLAPSHPGRWEHGTVTVCRTGQGGVLGHGLAPREPTVATARLRAHRARGRLVVLHELTPAELSEALVAEVCALAVDAVELELVLTGLVRSTVDDPLAAWTQYYRGSMAALTDGTAAFAPVHDRAAELVAGRSVLDLGSCFGFFPLRLARDGTVVTATDLCAGTVRLLAAVAGELGVGLRTLACDAAAVPLPDGCVDTVTVLHLLEHLEPDHGAAVLAEARRLARRRVVVAVPLESAAERCYGHVRTFTLDTLAQLGPGTVSTHHGGWSVHDLTH